MKTFNEFLNESERTDIENEIKFQEADYIDQNKHKFRKPLVDVKTIEVGKKYTFVYVVTGCIVNGIKDDWANHFEATVVSLVKNDKVAFCYTTEFDDILLKIEDNYVVDMLDELNRDEVLEYFDVDPETLKP